MRWALPLSSTCSSWRPCLACLPLCSPEYVALLRGTQALGTRELQALSKEYDAIYLHPVRALANPPTQSHIRYLCLFMAHVPMCRALLAATAGTRDWPGRFCSLLGAL